MSVSMASRYNLHRFGDGHIVSGVCTDLAARAGVPAWMPRAVFLLFGVLHWFLAIVLYVVLARTVCATGRAARRHVPAAPAMPSVIPPAGGVRDRLRTLDARLAELEAAALKQEASLRRQFRDL